MESKDEANQTEYCLQYGQIRTVTGGTSGPDAQPRFTPRYPDIMELDTMDDDRHWVTST
jgi:hypothetical protein